MNTANEVYLAQAMKLLKQQKKEMELLSEALIINAEPMTIKTLTKNITKQSKDMIANLELLSNNLK